MSELEYGPNSRSEGLFPLVLRQIMSYTLELRNNTIIYTTNPSDNWIGDAISCIKSVKRSLDKKLLLVVSYGDAVRARFYVAKVRNTNWNHTLKWIDEYRQGVTDMNFSDIKLHSHVPSDKIVVMLGTRVTISKIDPDISTWKYKIKKYLQKVQVADDGVDITLAINPTPPKLEVDLLSLHNSSMVTQATKWCKKILG